MVFVVLLFVVVVAGLVTSSCLVIGPAATPGKIFELGEESTLTEIATANIDPSLAEFLKKYFPAEVKAKQRENEQAVARDQFGDLYDAKCIMM